MRLTTHPNQACNNTYQALCWKGLGGGVGDRCQWVVKRPRHHRHCQGCQVGNPRIQHTRTHTAPKPCTCIGRPSSTEGHRHDRHRGCVHRILILPQHTVHCIKQVGGDAGIVVADWLVGWLGQRRHLSWKVHHHHCIPTTQCTQPIAQECNLKRGCTFDRWWVM